MKLRQTLLASSLALALLNLAACSAAPQAVAPPAV